MHVLAYVCVCVYLEPCVLRACVRACVRTAAFFSVGVVREVSDALMPKTLVYSVVSASSAMFGGGSMPRLCSACAAMPDSVIIRSGLWRATVAPVSSLRLMSRSQRR